MKTTNLLDGYHYEHSVERGMTVTRFNGTGAAHAKAFLDAVIATFPKPAVEWESLAAAKAKLTILFVGSNFMGVKAIHAAEVSLFPARDGKIGMLPKGARKHGQILNVGSVIDVMVGYGHIEDMRIKVEAAKAGFPALEELTDEDLAALPRPTLTDGSSPPVSLAVMGTVSLPDGDLAGAVWVLSEYDPDTDVADGVLYVPEPGISEYGSVYGRDLLERFGNWGKVAGFTGFSFKTAVDLTDGSYEAALAAVKEATTT